MSVKVTVTSSSGRDSYTVPRDEWRAEVARLVANPDVRQVTARQVEEFVHYAYNRPPKAR
jgi:hypothetical protein